MAMQYDIDGIESNTERQLPAVLDQRHLDVDSYGDADIAWLEVLLRELYRQSNSETIRLDHLDIQDFWQPVIEAKTGGDAKEDDERSAADQQAQADAAEPGDLSEFQTADGAQAHDPSTPEQNLHRTGRLQDRPRSLTRVIAGASKRQPRAQVEEDLYAALGEMLNTYDDGLLKRALDTLKRTGGHTPDSLVNTVCRLTTHQEVSVRRRAVNILGATSETELALPALIQALNDTRYQVRRNAAVALGKLGNRKAVVALLPALQDSSKRVRQDVVAALGELGDERAIEPLIASFQDSDEIVRQASLDVMISQFPQQALEPLNAALQDSDETVRQVAAEALEILENEGTAIDDSETNVRLAEVESSDRLEEGKTPQSVTPAHDQPGAPTAQVVRLVNTQTLESVISGLKKDDLQVRLRAAAQLGRMGDARAVVPLINLLGDHHLSVRENAAAALKDLGDLATEPLIDALNNRTGTVRRKAAQVLADTADERTQETFVAALDNPDGAVRWEAVRALSDIGTPQAWQAVAAYRGRQKRRARQKRILVRALLSGFALVAIVGMILWVIG